jgi:hypothetical protein
MKRYFEFSRMSSGPIIAAWTVLFLILIVEIHGFVRTGIFAQEMWSPIGLHRLGWLIIAYCVLAGTILKFRATWCGPVLLAVTIPWTYLVVGITPLLAVLLFLFASWTLGTLVFGRYLLSSDRTDQILALLLGVGVYSFLQGLMAHIPVNSSVSALLMLSAPLVIQPSVTRQRFIEIVAGARHLARMDGIFQGALAWIGFPVIACWLVALKPEVSTDGLAMHLAIPAFVAEHHYWGFDFQQTLWAVMPMGGDWCYTLVYLLGGEHAARLLNLAFLILIATLIFLISRRILPIDGSALLSGLFLTTPLVQLVTGSLFVENFWALLVLGAFAALLRTYDSRPPATPCMAGILLGIAISAKFGAIAFAVPLAVIACWLTWRQSSHSVAKSLPAILLFFCFLAVFAAQPYLNAFLKTGNPVFPFLEETFPSPYFDSSWFLDDVRFQRPVNFRFLYDLTFHTDRYMEGQAGAAGFQYLLLVPVCLALLFCSGGRYVGWMAFAVAVPAAWLTFIQQANLRYGYAAMPLLTVAFGAALGGCRTRHQHLYRFVMTLCVTVAIMNVYFSNASGSLHRDFWLNPLNPIERQRYLETYAPVRALVDHLNDTAPGEAVIFIGTNQIAGLNGRALTSTWHNKPIARRLETANSIEELLKVANDFKVQYFITPNPENSALPLPMFGPFLTAFTQPDYRSGSFYIAKLKSDFAGDAGLRHAREIQANETASLASLQITPLRASRPTLAAGYYDDDDPKLIYHGPWEHTKQYPKARGSSISYSTAIGGALEFSFVGRELTYVYTRAYNRGKASVNIDGEDVAIIDQYGPGIDWQIAKSWSGFSPGIHDVLIRVLPEKDPASEGFYIDVDAINIR